MTQPNQPNNEKEPQPGSRLSRALGGLRKEAVFIPPTVDESVLAKARPHLARIHMHQSLRKRTQLLALAACIAVLAVLAQTFMSRSGSGSKFVREDLNHDGRVDILDAFQLARELKHGQPPAKTEDFNGDGKVDEADVQFLAKRAVRLEKGGPS